MSGWSELPRDLLVSIRRRIPLIEDYLNFGRVCKSWGTVATKGNFKSDLPQAPWLMLSEEEDDSDSCRKFVSIYNGMILKKRIPKASGKRCFESMGWLITVGNGKGEISLLQPFSGDQIPLPNQDAIKTYQMNDDQPWKFDDSEFSYHSHKAVLSADPSHKPDYVLVIIAEGCEFLRFWRPGERVWTKVVNPYLYPAFKDVVYYNSHFYAIDSAGAILVCDVDSPAETAERHILVCVEDSEGHITEEEWQPPYDAKLYILESLGSLFVVTQHGDVDDDDDDANDNDDDDDDDDDDKYNYRTTHFLVFQADLATGRMSQTRDLGDTAFFLGTNTSLSVQASQFPGIKPNHIYFITDNCLDAYMKCKKEVLDMGVFNLADGSIKRHYEGVFLSPVGPPIWVTPTLC